MNNINAISLCLEKYIVGALKYNCVQKTGPVRTCSIPALYLLYICLYTGCCSRLLLSEMIFITGHVDNYGMDRRETRGFRLKALGGLLKTIKKSVVECLKPLG